MTVHKIYANTRRTHHAHFTVHRTLGGMVMVMVVVVIVVVVEWSCLRHLALVSVQVPFVGCAFSA